LKDASVAVPKVFKGKNSTGDQLALWVKRHTGTDVVGLPGCNAKLDRFTRDFFNTADNTARTAIVDKVDETIKDDPDLYGKKSPKTYIQMMKDILKAGNSVGAQVEVLDKEIKRVQKLLDGGPTGKAILTEDKKLMFQKRMCVLLTFKAYAPKPASAESSTTATPSSSADTTKDKNSKKKK